MSTKTNSLKVRRIDLLEQLQERYKYMVDEKDKYERAKEKYRLDCLRYEQALEKWEARIPDLMEGMVRGSEISYYHHHDSYRYGRRERWTASIEVAVDREDLQKLLGPEPTKPECEIDVPNFLRNRYQSSRYGSPEVPSVYQAVYQAIQLLSMSDDETVNASTYQIALEVL